MPDRNDLGDSFATWQKEMDDHLEETRLKRRCARMPFITVICLVISVLLAHWRHTVLVQHYCVPRTTACPQLNDPSTMWFWVGWTIAATLGLTVICVAVALAALVVRFVPRYGRLLYISGPFQDPDRRRQFIWWLRLIMSFTAGLLTLTVIESLV